MNSSHLIGERYRRVQKAIVAWASILGLTVVALLPLESTADEEQTEPASGEHLRDPTRPLSYLAPSSARGKNIWRLDSVLISNQRKLAIINGEFVKEQGWVKGAQVTRIETGQVTIMVEGKSRVLTLSTDIRKTKVEG